MDLLLIAAVMAISYIVLNIRPSREGDITFSLVAFIIGLFLVQEGMTFNSVTLLTKNTPMNFTLSAVMILGGLMSLYTGIGDYRKKKSRF